MTPDLLSKTRSKTSAEHPAPQPQPRVGGWHFVEWACELAGTFILLFLGLSVVVVLGSPASSLYGDIHRQGLRLVLIGLAFGLIVAAIALSPLGRRSGAHLNPAVTFGFWLRGHVHHHDLAGYSISQLLGALAAAALLWGVWGNWARRIDDATTVPTVSAPVAAAVECGLTAVLIAVVFAFLSSAGSARWTPAALVVLLPILIRIGAPYTGASMNPVRTIAPAIVSGNYRALWAYLVGPPLGAIAAVAALRLLAPERKMLTAKLFHDQRYPTVVKTLLPAQPAGAPVTPRKSD
jgi:aquaporin Z